MSISRRMRKCAASSLALASTLVFAACAGGPAPIDHYYRIRVADPTNTSGDSLAGTLHVDPLRTDGLVGQRHLLYRQQEDSAEIRQYNYQRWTNPPAIALQTALVSFLRDANVVEIVMEANTQTRPNYRVSGRVHRLEFVLGDSAVIVEIDLTATGTGGEVLVHESYTEQRAAADVAVSASAIGDAVHGIFERFLLDFRRTARRLGQRQQP